jgi:hypothetical protein
VGSSWRSGTRGGLGPWLLGGVALGLVIVLVVGLVIVLDPNRPVRELALRDARAAAAMDYGAVWQDYSACFQRRTQRAAFVAEQSQSTGVQRYRAPADTRYSVVAVTAQGAYRRVEVRVEAPGLGQLDYEIDVRMYGGRWAVVDRGDLGHLIHDDCTQGGGS